MVLHRQLLRLLSVGVQRRCLQFSVQTQNTRSCQFTLWYFLCQCFQQYFPIFLTQSICYLRSTLTTEPCIFGWKSSKLLCWSQCPLGAHIHMLSHRCTPWLFPTMTCPCRGRPQTSRCQGRNALVPPLRNRSLRGNQKTKKTISYTFQQQRAGWGGGRLYVSGSQLAGC